LIIKITLEVRSTLKKSLHSFLNITAVDILSIENVSKHYAQHVALDNVSVNVPTQSIFGLLGPNGAGKTTLIRIITQIIEADNGKIQVNGQPLAPHHVYEIGYLPEVRSPYKKRNVGEQLLHVAQRKGLDKKEAI